MELSAFTSLFFLLALFPWIISSDLNSEKSALLEFANALSHMHIRKLNWDPATQICTSWIGITCTKDGTKVIEIHLPNTMLYGSIPSSTIGKLSALTVLSLRSNYLHGKLPSDIFSIPSLQFLYLQNNNFSGEIPNNFPLLPPRVSVIDLSFNSLTGEFPSSFTKLKRLSMLKLEFNSIYGVIPINLDIPSLVLLNLSFNSLNGEIPLSLRKFSIASFIGNARLCGPPMNYCSSTHGNPSVSRIAEKSRKLSLISIIGIAIGGVFLLMILLVLAIVLKKKCRVGDSVIKANGGKDDNLKSEDFGSGVQGGEKTKLVAFEGCSFSFDFEDLLRASAEVLGKGIFGTSYKATLDEAKTVVVKRLKKEYGIGKKEFEQYIEIVNKVGRHRNVVPMIAYYCSKEEKFLVYEYLPANLSAALHGNTGVERTPLDWNARISVALGAARGIAHIHSAKLTHGNIKSSNILITETLEGRVSEFGLSPLMPSYTHVKCRVPICQAPEIMETRKASQKSDVFNFGVILLELLTGKSPIQCSKNGDMVDLPTWVQSVVWEEWTVEVFDVQLMRYPNVEEEMVQMLQIGLSCVAKEPDMRPTMDEAVSMIEGVRDLEVETRTSSEDD
ncbi:hypothetical protein BUALT_Bualt06G0074600 [Buddleja alternifolia]|uniref:Protein kinase domain-containing protein n=1 Tax=Buddleja alternifolia TaxID=168488 RepID=A0AAV6XPE8_9LAMI|nr:hypothetical protein BUALT_Bualt06G0074600 [Buddleja alternifolia]